MTILVAVLDPATSRLGGQADSLEDDWEPVNPHPGRGRYKRTTKKEKDEQRTSLSGRTLHRTAKAQAERDTPSEAAATPQPPGSSAHPILHQFSGGADQTTPAASGPAPSGRRPRPLTQHQLAVEAHRRSRVEYILALKKQKMFNELEQKRESGNWVARAAKRIEQLPDGYDSEDEENSWGMGGLVSNPNGGEPDDFEEESEMWVRVFRRVHRRLARWSGDIVEKPNKTKPPAASLPGSRALEASPAPSASRASPSVVKKRGGARRSTAKTPSRLSGRRKKPVNSDIASSQVGAESDVGGVPPDEEGNEADVDGEDVTMLVEEELRRPKPRRPRQKRETNGGGDEGLDDIDRDLLAEADSDDGEADQGEDDEADGGGTDIEMDD